MGKKNKYKHNSGASSSEGPPSKQHKISGQPSSPPKPEPTPVPTVEVNYSDMPENHKKKFYIYDDCGTLYKYIGIISWLRSMCCFYGSVFEGIPNLNWVGKGYPLVEIEVVTPSDNSVKFVISKNNLYMVGFYARNWFQFSECGFTITEFAEIYGYNGAYTPKSKAWERVGPKLMIDAVDFLATKCTSLNGHKANCIQALEVFMVHLCEAARLYPVESLICKTLAPSGDGTFDKRTYEDEENVTLPAKNPVKEENDVYSLVKANGPINFNNTSQTPDCIKSLIKKYSNLSKIWYVYALTNKKCFEMKPDDVSRFQMRSVKSLRCTLAVLCNINLNKVVEEWRKKTTHPIVTREVFDQMEKKVLELQEQKKVLLPEGSSPQED